MGEPLKQKATKEGGVWYFYHDEVKSATSWIIDQLEHEIEKAITDYHKMDFFSVSEELTTENLLIMYIETTLGRIQIQIDGIWFFPSLSRRFLDKLVRYSQPPFYPLLNRFYSIDNDITYFIRHHHSHKEG